MIIHKSVRYQRQQIIKKKISAVELAQEYIDQINKMNPLINAVMQVDPERILKDAANMDKRMKKGHACGPLHGIPITIKDNLLTKGIVTTGGSFAYSDFIPDEDATVVKRLREAGAVILGKTNLPDFALSWETASSAYGQTNNPYHLEHTAGGSSGGEAAIIAVCGSALGIGTDSGGSIRLPSHYCGIAGLKTSRGVVPSTGHTPPKEGCPILGVFANFSTIGPMARHVSDLIDTLPILAGSDGIDPYADNQLVRKTPAFSLKGMKIAFYTSVDGMLIAPEVSQALYETAQKLEDSGAIIDTVLPPGISEARHLYCSIIGADGGEGVGHLLKELGYDSIPSNLQCSLLLMEKEPSLRRFLDVSIQWDFFRIHLMNFMKDYDLILCPAAAFTALPHGRSFAEPEYFKYEHYLTPYNLMGWPAATVRVGADLNGLPIGVQIVSQHREDYRVLYAALEIEKLMGGWRTPY